MLLIAKVSRLLHNLSIALIALKFKGWGRWCRVSWLRSVWQLSMGGLLLAGCATLPPPTPAVLQPAPAAPLALADDPLAAIPVLLQSERQASAARDLAQLGQLWAEESRIVDGRGTAAVSDDLIWSGRAAILDRYQLAVFPNPPPPLSLPPALPIQVKGDQATLRNGQDRWRFVRQQGRWWLSELIYSQPD